MATTDKLQQTKFLPAEVAVFLTRRGQELTGMFLLSVAFVLGVAILSHDPADRSLNSTGADQIQNILGFAGALVSDLLLQSLGLATSAFLVVLVAWGLRSLSHRRIMRPLVRLTLLPAAILLLAAALAKIPTPDVWPFISGLGGVAGDLLVGQMAALDPILAQNESVLSGGLGILAAGVLAWCIGATWTEWLSALYHLPRRLWSAVVLGGRSGMVGSRAFGAGLDATAKLARLSLDAARQRREPRLSTALARTTSKIDTKHSRGEDVSTHPKPTVRTGEVEVPTKVSRRKRKRTARQESLDLAIAGEYRLPQLSLLTPQDTKTRSGPEKHTLDMNARMLEAVLQDFGVKGEIVKVRSGPVVTLYELEPAPGTKSSRVIGLGDDIARSMSAVSVRVAVVPGRNVIGIELPNINREMVFLREIFEDPSYEKASGKLPIALGKDIAGAPVVVDLARMPHLLIAGTTGSGKSVAVNTMILSLLYHLPPERCRMIMVDPKMLELSIYDGIPHLLAPVVTDPQKAVVALKWTVREMESRYRAMSKLGVRNIDGYNARLAEARKKGEVLKRRVQTGFDTDTGKPVFEDETLDVTPLPFIVVVIDEVADLMLVAGKDIEGAVQRLAQMARAAGIHVIMATQRPSVDVITGTIKANFPTRISFQVTSKIDSRTILGEQGAEQLLSQGDMLHMAGGGRVTRVHGPFVSDEEVEDVVMHLRAQGEPEYDDSITEESEVGDPLAPYGLGAGNADGGSDDNLYDQALAVVARERKASTSFVQRQLKIGYNRAASIIERMETEGVVSAANHVGKRQVLVGDHSSE
ncbi:MAG: cell division protein FtsK [Rhodospirillaceae bacterium]|nr:cell division protein FtsK [Rhodospirillaceae bacterium]